MMFVTWLGYFSPLTPDVIEDQLRHFNKVRTNMLACASLVDVLRVLVNFLVQNMSLLFFFLLSLMSYALISSCVAFFINSEMSSCIAKLILFRSAQQGSCGTWHQELAADALSWEAASMAPDLLFQRIPQMLRSD